ncbi:MAG: c-type cytochrome [Proteobacteria bacterium]|nr:c-type cytochrome [Pseudomonadota bacterium]
MQVASSKLHLGSLLLGGMTVLMLLSANVAAQSVAENIRPVAQVCLAGQPCVGSTGRSTSGVSPVVATTAAPPAATVAQPPAVAAAPQPEAVVAEVATAAFDAATTYQMSCFACHGTGAAGAPQPGETEVWEARLEKGMEQVMVNVVSGLNAMPARGLCMTCSDDNLQALVDFMVNQ